ncbi:MAG: hypothetical protein LC751_15605 [Actinobacteria bacterium]|nr:hypothetical protein [Actinomycetota bacterium]
MSRTSPGVLQSLGKLRIVGVVLISLVGLIHLLVTSEYFEYAAYVGLLFLVNVACSILSAYGIYRGASWGWILGLVISVGSFMGYIVSRTVGLPGAPGILREPFTEPPGLLSLVVELAFAGVAAYVLTRRSRDTASSGEVT